MEQRLRFSLWVLASFLLPIAIMAVVAIVKPVRLAQSSTAESATSDLPVPHCQTIIADPNPPLNVRSSPIVAPDNEIGRLPNGTTLSIVDENEGWLQISSPIQGWVYKELTVTNCANSTAPTPIATADGDRGVQLMAIAIDQYQSGNLNGAIALAKTVAPNSSAYRFAQAAIAQWQRDWNRAESDYYSAQKALRDGRWQDALDTVNGYPDIRYWKEKLAPIVQQAMKGEGREARGLSEQ